MDCWTHSETKRLDCTKWDSVSHFLLSSRFFTYPMLIDFCHAFDSSARLEECIIQHRPCTSEDLSLLDGIINVGNDGDAFGFNQAHQTKRRRKSVMRHGTHLDESRRYVAVMVMLFGPRFNLGMRDTEFSTEESIAICCQFNSMIITSFIVLRARQRRRRRRQRTRSAFAVQNS